MLYPSPGGTNVRRSEQKVPEGRQNCSPGRKPWVANPNSHEPRKGRQKLSAKVRCLSPLRGFRMGEGIPRAHALGYNSVAPSGLISPVVELPMSSDVHRMPPSKILYRVRGVKALAIGKNRKL